MTVVPRPGALAMSIVPPVSAAKPRMAAMPDSNRLVVGSKPTPSSTTWTWITSPAASIITSTQVAWEWRRTLRSASWTMRRAIVSVVQSSTRRPAIDMRRRGAGRSP